MNLDRKQIGELLKLPEEYIVIDKAIYDQDYPNDLKVSKLLAKDDIDFKSHIPDHLVYPDKASGLSSLSRSEGYSRWYDRTYKVEGTTLSKRSNEYFDQKVAR